MAGDGYGHRFDARGIGVVDAQFRRRVEGGDHLRVVAALLAAADDRGPRPAARSPVPDTGAAGGGGAGGRDLGGVHDRDGHAGRRVVDDDQAVDVRQAERLVRRIAGDPLDRGDVGVLEIGRHRVDERVLARVDAGLRRQLDAARGHRPVRVRDEVDLCFPGREQAADLAAREVQDRFQGPRILRTHMALLARAGRSRPEHRHRGSRRRRQDRRDGEPRRGELAVHRHACRAGGVRVDPSGCDECGDAGRVDVEIWVTKGIERAVCRNRRGADGAFVVWRARSRRHRSRSATRG